MEFFILNLKEFFNRNQFQEASWGLVKNSMMNDDDIVSNKYGDGDYGTVFKDILEKS